MKKGESFSSRRSISQREMTHFCKKKGGIRVQLQDEKKRKKKKKKKMWKTPVCKWWVGKSICRGVPGRSAVRRLTAHFSKKTIAGKD